ncbi:low molecular weight protein-tyrosine-phosphatase [Chakrabartyella piscis]|uniref:low molecular weight protein-tyrosine-phosphatase n=1 Tax=Chakrabartyella piscis TaxID=2918914 RepID=UPI00295858F0|nr:low molecular weight protein-tyrosine-phosphatase [Chakrabartyella piscis]
MTSVLFICHGNICRSPMAEFLFRDMVKTKGIASDFSIASAATSREEIGNGVHRGTKQKLNSLGIDCSGKTARQVTKRDYDTYDYLLVMDGQNTRNLMRILGDDPENKVYRLLDFGKKPRDIADPWYTGNFEATYNDVMEGLEGFLLQVQENKI